MSTAGVGTNLFAEKTSTLEIALTDKNDYAVLARGSGAPPTTANIFAPGCIYIRTDDTTGHPVLYENIGSTATPSWKKLKEDATLTPDKTVATTGNTDFYVIVPNAGKLSSVDFSGVDALAASDTNYVTFSITNLGQAGSGSTAMLVATDANTTKATGGTAIAANTKRSLTLHGTAANLVVAAGDRLRVRVAATGTLANTVTFANLLLRFNS